MRNINKIPTQAEYEAKEFISPSLNKVVENDMLHWDSTSDRLTSGADEKVFAIELYEVVTALPGSPEYNKIYLIEDEDTGAYKQYGWINEEWVYYGTNEGAIPPVSSLTQAEYDALVAASAVSQNVLYNITDSEALNTDTYQKKLVAGDFIRIDQDTNTIDCTLDQNLYIIVDTLPPVGIENKIYLVKRTMGDGTVVFVQYAWNVNGDNTFTEYGNTGTVSVKGGSGVSVSSDATVETKIESPLKYNPATSGITVEMGRGVQISNNSIETKPGAGLKFDGTSAMTVNVGSGVSVVNSAITTNKGDGIAFNASSALTVQAASGISVTSNGVSAKLTAPLIFNSNSAITVSSSSTYTSTGTELFTRAGAYDLYSNLGKSATVAVGLNTATTYSTYYSLAYQIVPSAPLYFFKTMIKMKAVNANTEVFIANVTINGKGVSNRMVLAGANRSTTSTVNVLWSILNSGRAVYINAEQNIGDGQDLVISGLVYCDA